jgi:hypothetical protein
VYRPNARYSTSAGFALLLLLATACSSPDDVAPVSDAGHSGPDATGTNDGAPSPHDGGDAGDAGDAHDSSVPGAPTAEALLAKVAACDGTAIKGGFGLDGSGSLSMYACGAAVYWKADLDVDCDGIQSPPCDTDHTGQPQTSIVDDAPDGDVDPTLLPYFVIPLGDPETTWYKAHGIGLGQVGAVIYKGQVQYGIFADEAGGSFIGEASYAMCQLFLGAPGGGKDPCDPNHGGIDPADVTYVTFTGSENRAKGGDIYAHENHTDMGITAAKAWLATP